MSSVRTVKRAEKNCSPSIINKKPSKMISFAEKVRAVVKTIPKGSVMTYKDVAAAAGNPRAARAVANTMAKNFDETVPCHRVIRSDGTVGGYNRGGHTVKKQLLLNEGAVI